MIKDNDNGQFVGRIKLYWDTYLKQPGAMEYSVDTLVRDALYGTGICLSDKYEFADGNRLFLQHLRDWLDEEIERISPADQPIDDLSAILGQGWMSD